MTSLEVILLFVAMKCPIFVNRSIITSIASFPSASGSCVIMSIDIEVQGWSGIDNDFNNPYLRCRATLFCWQVSHDKTYFLIKLRIPVQWKVLVVISCVLNM